MTSPKVQLPVKSSLVYGINAGLSCEKIFDKAYRKILGAKTERERWAALMACGTWLLEGLPENQRQAFIIAAIWRVAVSAIRRYLRNGQPQAFSQMAPDLATALRGAMPGFTPLDFERIAIDAIHSLPPKSFKRRRATYACDL